MKEDNNLVKVCDAIMGSGKTSATITYINEHPEKKFIYITPYLDEAERIKQACPQADFVEPNNKDPKYAFSKTNHTAELVREGRNIASTHQCLMYYTPEMFQDIQDQGYTIVIDEEVSVLDEEPSLHFSDIQIAVETGFAEECSPNEYCITERGMAYQGGLFTPILKRLRARSMVCLGTEKHKLVYYWRFSHEMFKIVDEVIVLTYLFERSEMEAFFKAYDIEYTVIGVSKDDRGYRFCDHKDYIPAYVANLDKMLLVDDSDKINAIGKRRTALSMSWYNTKPDEVDQLRKNIYNYFKHRMSSYSVESRMCGTFKKHWGKIRGKGYWNSDVVFSQKATNAYSNKEVLAYPVNLFANGNLVTFYSNLGYPFDNDRWALSTMLQWIWRSAIRNGKPVCLYLPSLRMRTLLYKWIEDTQKEYFERYGKEE